MDIKIPDNPLKEARLRHNLTQYELANLASISPQKILRDEQFVYIDPSPDTLRILERYYGEDPLELGKLYRLRRFKLHEDFYEALSEQPFYQQTVQLVFDYVVDHFDVPTVQSPTRLFRSELFKHYGLPDSAIKFSQYTGMHPGALSNIETGKIPWESAVPFVDILLLMLIPNETIKQLGVLHDQYFTKKVM